MGYFAAYLGGRVVEYPQKAIFVIDQKKGRGRFKLVASKSSLTQAISKFRRAERPEHTTRLRAVQDGRFHTLLQEQG